VCAIIRCYEARGKEVAEADLSMRFASLEGMYGLSLYGVRRAVFNDRFQG
jgi:hypothetical protein